MQALTLSPSQAMFATYNRSRPASVEGRLDYSLRGLSPYHVECVLEYIHLHVGETLSLETLSACIGMSPYHFARLFKQSLGVTPHQYVIRYRIECSKGLVIADKCSMTDIAYQLGFSSPSHFSAVFRKLTGLTPTAYRQSLFPRSTTVS